MHVTPALGMRWYLGPTISMGIIFPCTERFRVTSAAMLMHVPVTMYQCQKLFNVNLLDVSTKLN